MFELVIFVLLALVVPVLVNKTTESHLHWLTPRHLRPIWTVVFAILSLYLLQKPTAHEFIARLHLRWHGRSYLVLGLAGGLLLYGYWWLTGVMLKPAATKPIAQNDKQPTLLDLFKNDFPHTMKQSDQEDVICIKWSTGGETTIKRQVYMNFSEKTKFAGFYIPMHPSSNLSGEKTCIACLKLLEGDAVQKAFDHFSTSMAVLAGYGSQMTSIQDLTFSGRVLIYHEEFLSIPQKAQIIEACASKKMDVQFYGGDYLGLQVIAWHQQHSAKAAH
jgi:hypothetical protein